MPRSYGQSAFTLCVVHDSQRMALRNEGYSVKHSRRLIVAYLVIASLCAHTLLVADPAESADEAGGLAEVRKYWLEICTNHADDYEIFPIGERESEFKRLPKPIFGHTQRHSERNRAGQYGLVFLWLEENGRPAVVGTVLATALRDREPAQRRMAHVLESLSSAPLTAAWRGQELWTPTEAGVRWQAVPGAPIPARTGVGRLRQMRALAGQFQSYSIDSKGGRWELRLLPKPVYDWDLRPAESAVGGALFVLCEGTDPEVFLALESRKTDRGPRWHFAFAPFSNYELHASHAGKEVWTVSRRPNSVPKTSPRWVIRGIEYVPEPGRGNAP